MVLLALVVGLVLTLVAAVLVMWARRRGGAQPADGNPNLGLGIGIGIAVGIAVGISLWNLTGDFIWYIIFVGAGLSTGLAIGSARKPRWRR